MFPTKVPTIIHCITFFSVTGFVFVIVVDVVVVAEKYIRLFLFFIQLENEYTVCTLFCDSIHNILFVWCVSSCMCHLLFYNPTYKNPVRIFFRSKRTAVLCYRKSIIFIFFCSLGVLFVVCSERSVFFLAGFHQPNSNNIVNRSSNSSFNKVFCVCDK